MENTDKEETGKRQLQSKKRYLYAFLIGTIVFILIFAISYSISYFEFTRVASLQIGTSFQIFEDKLDYSFFDAGVCSNESFQKISSDLNFQGRIIDDLERKLGKNDKNVLLRKEYYTLVELEHFELIKLLNKNCNLKKHTILFFYSNKEDKLGDSEDLGRLLGTVFSDHESNLIIYSFDIDLNINLITKLKQKYKIEEPLTIIINEKEKIVNPKNVDEVEKYLK